MSVIALASAKGSPGVTTLAHRLADILARREAPERGGSGREVVLVEADPAGGDIAARSGLRASPGLATLVLTSRRSLTAETVLAHCQRLGRLLVLTGVAGARQGTIVAPVVPRVVEALTGLGSIVVVDAGRVGDVADAAEPLLAGASLVALVTRTGTDAMVHARSAVRGLESSGIECGIVLVGRSRSPLREIEAVLGASVLGVVADAPGEADQPLASATARPNDLQRSVEALATTLLERLDAAGVVSQDKSATEKPDDAGAVSLDETVVELPDATAVARLDQLRVQKAATWSSPSGALA